jgi:ribulose-phosphate 3-epimerase
MPVEIIPAILAKDEKELRRKVESVDGLCEMVQLDVMDGKFVDNVTWADPDRLQKMPLPMPFEVHLMVQDPLERLDAWSLAGCQRVLIHAESVDDLAAALREAASYGMEAGISINPETSVADIEDAVAEADVVQVMGVNPGHMGQPFQEIAVEKVAELREKFPELVIEVDGGVSVGVARRLADAGADRLVSGSAVFNSGAPAKSLDALRQDVDFEV